MLLLTRKEGESIHVGKDIVVTFLGMQGRSARIGISAPKEIEIFRDEVLQRRIAEGQTGRVKT